MTIPECETGDIIRWSHGGDIHEGVVMDVLAGQYLVDDGSGVYKFVFKRDYTIRKIELEGGEVA
jgi:hypothetical protein